MAQSTLEHQQLLEMSDYYATLGVERNADVKIIKKAYRALALQWHPVREQTSASETRRKEAESWALEFVCSLCLCAAVAFMLSSAASGQEPCPRSRSALQGHQRGLWCAERSSQASGV